MGKAIYIVIIAGLVMMYRGNMSQAELFLHMLLFMTVIGAFLNTNLFNPSKEKYYAIFLMRMAAKQYVLINYGYSILKVIVDFLSFVFINCDHSFSLSFCTENIPDKTVIFR